MKLTRAFITGHWNGRAAIGVAFDKPLEQAKPLHHAKQETDGGISYLGFDEDYAHFLHHSPDNQTGFGGATFDLTLTDGRQVTVKGPWSSRAGVMNAVFCDLHKPVVEVSCHCRSIAVTVEEALRRLGVPLREVTKFGEPYFEADVPAGFMGEWGAQ